MGKKAWHCCDGWTAPCSQRSAIYMNAVFVLDGVKLQWSYIYAHGKKYATVQSAVRFSTAVHNERWLRPSSSHRQTARFQFSSWACGEEIHTISSLDELVMVCYTAVPRENVKVCFSVTWNICLNNKWTTMTSNTKLYMMQIPFFTANPVFEVPVTLSCKINHVYSVHEKMFMLNKQPQDLGLK